MTNRIKEIIAQRGLTVNELAEKLGITRVTLSSQINGSANIKSYEKIAAALGVPMWQLFADSKEVCSAKDGQIMVIFHGDLFKADSIEELERLIAVWKSQS